MECLLPHLGVAPSGECLWSKGRHGVFEGKTVRSMPERFEIYIIYKMVLYKYSSSFLFPGNRCAKFTMNRFSRMRECVPGSKEVLLTYPSVTLCGLPVAFSVLMVPTTWFRNHQCTGGSAARHQVNFVSSLRCLAVQNIGKHHCDPHIDHFCSAGQDYETSSRQNAYYWPA